MVSVIEAILDDPRQVLMAQQYKAKGEAVAEMKADGVEYDERMALLDEVTWPKPLAELLEATFEIFRQSHPWVSESALSPKSVVRDMYERAMTFAEFVSAYQLARSEGLVLRYLTDAYRTLRQTVPAAHRSEQFDDLFEWLGETVRQTDSSLLDEWEALSDPDANERLEELEGLAAHGGTRPARPITANERAFRVMVRNAMFRRVQLAALDRFGDLAPSTRRTPSCPSPRGAPSWTKPPGTRPWAPTTPTTTASPPTPTPAVRSCSPSPPPADPRPARTSRTATTASGRSPDAARPGRRSRLGDRGSGRPRCLG